MARTATATVKMNEQGRVYIPSSAREKLEIDGEETFVEIEVRVDD